ncbi:MAG: hypothetical protein ACP5NZ_02235 [Nanobdellota archaeon]
MITLTKLGEISPIFLTVLLIIYLIIVELGSKKIRKALMPFVVVLAIAFMILAVISVYTTYINLK